MKSCLIIGMGSFGHHLCKALSEQKCEVMIVDQSKECVEDMLHYAVSAKIGDCTNKEVLSSFAVEEFDVCFVCMANNFQNSLQITSLLKELGAKKVLSRADEDVQAKFLLRNGADEIIYPEKEVARNLAIRESSRNIFDCINLAQDYAIYEISPIKKWIGKSLKEINFRVKYNLNIVAIKKDGIIKQIPSADYIFNEFDHLLVMGHVDDINKIAK